MRPAPVFLVRVLTIAALASSVCCAGFNPRHGTGRVDVALQAVQHSPGAKFIGRDTVTARQTHSRATLGTLLTALNDHAPPRTWTATQSIEGWTVTFAGDVSGLKSIPPSWCDSIAAVNPSKPLARLEKRVSTTGEGLPVVMVQKNAAGKGDPHIPKHGRRLPATLTADFEGGKKVTLTFHNTRNVESAQVRGAGRALASDLSAPIAEAMSRRHLHSGAVRSEENPARSHSRPGIRTTHLGQHHK